MERNRATIRSWHIQFGQFMFDNLSGRLAEATRNLTGKGRLSESNIKDTLRQVRLALLEADVALPVVRSFVEKIKLRAVGEEVGKSLTPGQALVKIIHAELVACLATTACRWICATECRTTAARALVRSTMIVMSTWTRNARPCGSGRKN